LLLRPYKYTIVAKLNIHGVLAIGNGAGLK
jgi:hypothetical protein